MPLGKLCSGDDSRRPTSWGKEVVVLGMNLKVLAGAIILGEVVLRPRVGEKGAVLVILVSCGLIYVWDVVL